MLLRWTCFELVAGYVPLLWVCQRGPGGPRVGGNRDLGGGKRGSGFLLSYPECWWGERKVVCRGRCSLRSVWM